MTVKKIKICGGRRNWMREQNSFSNILKRNLQTVEGGADYAISVSSITLNLIYRFTLHLRCDQNVEESKWV